PLAAPRVGGSDGGTEIGIGDLRLDERRAHRAQLPLRVAVRVVALAELAERHRPQKPLAMEALAHGVAIPASLLVGEVALALGHDPSGLTLEDVHLLGDRGDLR